jgi:hypothetical protein
VGRSPTPMGNDAQARCVRHSSRCAALVIG